MGMKPPTANKLEHCIEMLISYQLGLANLLYQTCIAQVKHKTDIDVLSTQITNSIGHELIEMSVPSNHIEAIFINV